MKQKSIKSLIAGLCLIILTVLIPEFSKAQKIEKLFEKGQFEKAEEYCVKKKGEKQEECYWELINAYSKRGDNNKAKEIRESVFPVMVFTMERKGSAFGIKVHVSKRISFDTKNKRFLFNFVSHSTSGNTIYIGTYEINGKEIILYIHTMISQLFDIQTEDYSKSPKEEHFSIEQFDEKGLKLNLNEDTQNAKEINIDGDFFKFSHYGTPWPDDM